MNKKQPLFHFGTAQEILDDVQKMLPLEHLVILKQMHSNKGHLITKDNYQVPARYLDGDFLITDMSSVGLGVLTADCLPIVLFDNRRAVVGIAHAGWRGAIRNIVTEIVTSMEKNYGTLAADLFVVFGPCAQVCCYKVHVDFIAELVSLGWNNDAIVYNDDSFFFDQLYFNEQILLSLGVLQNNIAREYSKCTICDETYFSYRRQGDVAGRQVSVVAQYYR